MPRGPFRNGDVYGVMKKEIEVDSDINEDRNREWLLDQSVSAFLNAPNQLNNTMEVRHVPSQQQTSE